MNFFNMEFFINIFFIYIKICVIEICFYDLILLVRFKMIVGFFGFCINELWFLCYWFRVFL